MDTGKVVDVGEAAAASPSDSVLERGIALGPWTVSVFHGSIANTSEFDQIAALLGIPAPEMPFPRNALVMRHAPSGCTYMFDGMRALQCIDGVAPAARRTPLDCARENALAEGADPATLPLRSTVPSSAIQVAYAKEWGQSRYVARAHQPNDAGHRSHGQRRACTAHHHRETVRLDVLVHMARDGGRHGVCAVGRHTLRSVAQPVVVGVCLGTGPRARPHPRGTSWPEQRRGDPVLRRRGPV